MWPHPKPVTPGHSCVTTRKAAKMTDHNDPEFGFDKTAADRVRADGGGVMRHVLRWLGLFVGGQVAYALAGWEGMWIFYVAAFAGQLDGMTS